jgi:hypothetical protein
MMTPQQKAWEDKMLWTPLEYLSPREREAAIRARRLAKELQGNPGLEEQIAVGAATAIMFNPKKSKKVGPFYREPEYHFDPTKHTFKDPYYCAKKSRETARDQQPAVYELVKKLAKSPDYAHLTWKKNTLNYDLGGGRTAKLTYLLGQDCISNIKGDPFHMSREALDTSRSFIMGHGGADTVTVSNVLNTIPSPHIRSAIIGEAAYSLKPGGYAFFTVYEGDDKKGEARSGKLNRETCQLNRKTADYVPEVSWYFEKVKRRGQLIIASSPHNIKGVAKTLSKGLNNPPSRKRHSRRANMSPEYEGISDATEALRSIENHFSYLEHELGEPPEGTDAYETAAVLENAQYVLRGLINELRAAPGSNL